MEHSNKRSYNREDLAWLAGLFDGEGHVGRHVKTNRVYAELSQSSAFGVPYVLSKAEHILGFGKANGPYYERTRVPMYRFQMSGFEKVQAWYAMMYPWLGEVKRAQFETVLQGYLHDRKKSGVKYATRRNWDEQSITYLHKNYNKLPAQFIADKLGRTVSSVRSMAKKLELTNART